MRSTLYKCPNHLGCTTGYHGDDIEVPEGAALVCPECGSPLRRVTRPRSAIMPTIVNLVVIACIATGIYLAWPSAVKLWKQITTPAAKK